MKVKTPLVGFNRWPEALGPEWKAKVVGYYNECFAFGLCLWRAFAMALGLEEEALDKLVTFPPCNKRMLRHPYTPEHKDLSPRDAPGTVAHKRVFRSRPFSYYGNV